ncbi:hypothetical protein B0H13DRAFT_2371029 [Mycena leptocephala]|nr:hypothetical protein B0H13DRAFT_2371029 [Mycena leptocephala]
MPTRAPTPPEDPNTTGTRAASTPMTPTRAPTPPNPGPSSGDHAPAPAPPLTTPTRAPTPPNPGPSSGDHAPAPAPPLTTPTRAPTPPNPGPSSGDQVPTPPPTDEHPATPPVGPTSPQSQDPPSAPQHPAPAENPSAPPPAVVTKKKEKRSRHQKGQPKARPGKLSWKGQPKARPGKLSWVHGTKKVFFERRKEDWLLEAEENRAGAFYTKMTKLYILKYGYDLADDQDLEQDVEDPPDAMADAVVYEVLDQAQIDFRAQYRKTLRVRIGQWYRLEYGSLLKSDKTAFKELFTGVLDGAPPKPQRGRINHFYSRNFYDTCIKARVEARLAALQRRAENTGGAPPNKIEVIARVTAEVWEEETPAFRQECELALECEYQAALKAWEASLVDSPSRSAEEVAATLENAAFYLQPVHAGTTKGLAAVNWPKHDWQGFQDVEKSMIGFARECFSDAECRARVVAGSVTESGTGSQTASGSSASASGSRAAGSAGPVPAPALPAPVLRGAVQPPPPAPGAQSNPSMSPDVQMGMDTSDGDGHGNGIDNGGDNSADRSLGNDEGGGGDGGTGGDGGAGDIGDAAACDEYWQRDDRGEWTEELVRAHAALELGRGWGVGWAKCVANFFDFESAWGFAEGSWQIVSDGA